MKIHANKRVLSLENKVIKLTKISDDKFEGNHPNDINKGYITQGKCINDITEGDGVLLIDGERWFRTSAVTKIIDNNSFKTLNSTYEIQVL